jgi:transposase-like protein
MSSKKAKSTIAKVSLENADKDPETKAGAATEQVDDDNELDPTVIPPAASEPQPTVAERLATREPVTGLGTSVADIIREARGPIPPLTQAANARKALDDAVKAKIIELLGQPNANMTKIANELGVSYGTVQSIKSKLAKPTPAARAPRAVTPKAVAQPVIDDVELMKLELEFLRKKVAYLESRPGK